MRSVKVKICGITKIEDALKAVEFGADAIGFVFYKDSPRHVSPEIARDIIHSLPPFITTVGVFVNEHPSTIERVLKMTGIDVVQLHGNESPEVCTLWLRVIKAIRVREITDIDLLCKYKVSAYLLDTYSPDTPGGTGQTFDWDIAVEAKRYGPIILAGGLTPENVMEAVRKVRPYAVDVSSGVESEKGVKDHEKLRRFIQNAKSVMLHT
jgi:phosphoribosylanthranilate isomerase